MLRMSIEKITNQSKNLNLLAKKIQEIVKVRVISQKIETVKEISEVPSRSCLLSLVTSTTLSPHTIMKKTCSQNCNQQDKQECNSLKSRIITPFDSSQTRSTVKQFVDLA